MENSKNIKEIVKEKYGAIAKDVNKEAGCGCGCGSSSKKIVDYTIFSDDYSKLDGYSKDADLGLGCGLPTEFANLKSGDIVVDCRRRVRFPGLQRPLPVLKVWIWAGGNSLSLRRLS